MTISINHLINFIERERKSIILRHESPNMVAPCECYFFLRYNSICAAWSLGAISQRVNLEDGSGFIHERIGNKCERDRCPSICIAQLSRYYHHIIIQILAKKENAEYRRKACLFDINGRSNIDLCDFMSKVVFAFWQWESRVATGNTWKTRKIYATIISQAIIKIKW